MWPVYHLSVICASVTHVLWLNGRQLKNGQLDELSAQVTLLYLTLPAGRIQASSAQATRCTLRIPVKPKAKEISPKF